MSDPTDFDDKTTENKLAYLREVGAIALDSLPIPLDPDLVDAFKGANDATRPLSKTDVVLVQVLRLLRKLDHSEVNNEPDSPPAVG